MLFIISLVSCILAISGNLLINFKKKSGFIVWILSNISWILVNFIGVTNYPQVLMYLVYLVINIDGFIRWRKKDDDKEW